MTETIAGVILIISFSGMALIISRKIPILAGLSAPEIKNASPLPSFSEFKQEIFNSFSLLSFLEKTLRKFKILTLRIENKIASWLENVHRRSQGRKNISDDNYWEELKKIPKR